jgi:metallo-beta-lactamase class B
MKVSEDGGEYDVVFIGSTTSPGYTLVDNPRYPNIVADYEYTFRLLRSLPCDVFLGPHGSFFNLEEKAGLLARGEKPNPFIEGSSYRSFLDRTEKDFRELLSKQLAAKSKKTP